MSISLYNYEKLIGDVATNSGYVKAMNFVKSCPFAKQEIKSFFNAGTTDDPHEVGDQAMVCALKTNDLNIRSVLINLHNMLRRVDGTVIVRT